MERHESGFSLRLVTVGTSHTVEFHTGTRQAHITTGRHNAVGMLNRIHHAHGVNHAYWATNGWGWLLAAASVLLLVLAGSGVIMWFMRHRERRAGAVVLVAGLAWGLTLLGLMRTA